MNETFQIKKELEELNREKELSKLSLEKEQMRIVGLIKNGLGDDINNVLSGKEIVQLSFFEKIKYKIKYFFDNLFNIL